MRRRLMLVLLASFLVWAGWMSLSLFAPSAERELRETAHDWLIERFPERMDLDDSWHGLHRTGGPGEERVGRVVLVHGLDEPGTIFDVLAPALAEAGFEVWQLNYPNDQAIARSTAFMAEHWAELEPEAGVYLVGHSMGGLVIRDFLTRVRPADGPAVLGAVLLAVPNQGSEWARFRGLLEIRELLTRPESPEAPAFAGLRAGTGAAKLDLLHGSEFLQALNARPWPEEIPVIQIAGVVLDGVEFLGDGVVSLESVRLEGLPEPIELEASHRGLLVFLPGIDQQPPAVPLIVEQLEDWAGVAESRF